MASAQKRDTVRMKLYGERRYLQNRGAITQWVRTEMNSTTVAGTARYFGNEKRQKSIFCNKWVRQRRDRFSEKASFGWILKRVEFDICNANRLKLILRNKFFWRIKILRLHEFYSLFCQQKSIQHFPSFEQSSESNIVTGPLKMRSYIHRKI